MKPKNNKPQSVQGVSAKRIEDINMYSDGGRQTATASESAKRVLMDARRKRPEDKRYIWDSWFDTRTKQFIVSIIAIIVFLSLVTAALVPLYELTQPTVHSIKNKYEK